MRCSLHYEKQKLKWKVSKFPDNPLSLVNLGRILRTSPRPPLLNVRMTGQYSKIATSMTTLSKKQHKTTHFRECLVIFPCHRSKKTWTRFRKQSTSRETSCIHWQISFQYLKSNPVASPVIIIIVYYINLNRKSTSLNALLASLSSAHSIYKSNNRNNYHLTKTPPPINEIFAMTWVRSLFW